MREIGGKLRGNVAPPLRVSVALSLNQGSVERHCRVALLHDSTSARVGSLVRPVVHDATA